MNRNPGEPNTRSRSSDEVEVAVIGAGQAGLAIGYFLSRQGRRFVILDCAGEIGSAWRERWESLTLFTPRRYSALPGLPFPGDPDGYPDAGRGDRLSRAPCRDLRPADRVEQRGQEARAGRPRALPPRAPRANDHRRPGGGRNRSVPVALRSDVRGRVRRGRVPDARDRLPQTRPGAARNRACGRRWQHRFSDREGAFGDAQGRALGGFSSDAAAAAAAWTRSLLVADEGGRALDDGRVAARSSAAAPGYADRLEPARAPSATASS